MTFHRVHNTGLRIAVRACLALIATTGTVRAQSPPAYAFSITLSNMSGGFWPLCLGVDMTGQLYASVSGDVVVKFAPNGSVLTQWPATAGGNLAANQANEVFITDPVYNRVVAFTTDGDMVAAWGNTGNLPGQFNSPAGVAVDQSGNVYVVDSFNDRIQVFDSSGGFLDQWGIPGDGAGELAGPFTLAIDTSNTLYVTDVPNNFNNQFRVQRFTLDGIFIAQWAAHGANSQAYVGIAGIATDASKRVYSVDSANNVVDVYDPVGHFLTQWGGFGSAPGRFNYPGGIAVDPSGNFVYVADYYNGRIQVFAYAPGAPLVFSQPLSQTVPAGATATFSAGVYGAAPQTYTWLLNGVPVPGATGTTLTVDSVSLAASGSEYSFSVTNSLGWAISSNAILTVVPVVLTTLPASGISATGAVLNGSATVGPYSSTAWFEWGTDPSYGNVSGLTNVSSGATLSVASPLNGLSGLNTYHYRVAASNLLGVAYGNDQTFAVGLKPTVATLPVVNLSATAATLNGVINPNGLDTSAFFRWGTSSTYTKATTPVAMGDGAVPSNLSAVVTGLVAGVVYHYAAVASNKLGQVTGSDATFISGPWRMTTAPNRNWVSVACSADGTRLVGAGPYQIWTSADGGETWRSNSIVEVPWQAVASSADGFRLIAAAGGSTSSRIYVSTNGGNNWTLSSAPVRNWYGVASSGDGMRLAAADANGRSVFTSSEAGASWTSNNVPSVYRWCAIACSADGSKLVAAAGGANPGAGTGPIYSSANGGLTWVSNSAPRHYWTCVASSADGRHLAAGAGGFYTNGPIYLSADAGLNWHAASAPQKNWQGITISADGTRLAAVVHSANLIYLSTDAGGTWVPNTLPSSTWNSIASSADGGKIIAGTAQNLFTRQTTVPPSLAAAVIGNNIALAWIVPSVSFSLQQATALQAANWLTVTNAAALVPNNLREQVILPRIGPNTFYRLALP